MHIPNKKEFCNKMNGQALETITALQSRKSHIYWNLQIDTLKDLFVPSFNQ
jgi:hypothetical protein